MEEKVYRRQVQKQGLAQRVLDEQQVGRFFSSGDLKELYTFECEETPENEDDGGKRFKKPKDGVFADFLYQGNWSRRITKYHEVSFTGHFPIAPSRGSLVVTHNSLGWDPGVRLKYCLARFAT